MRDLLAALAPPPRRGRAFTVGASVVVAVAVAAAAGHAVHLRRAARQRTELVGRLRGLAPELRTRLLSAHMLPRHDIRPARDEVRRAMQDVERVLQTPEGQDEIALVDLVLGEGYRALGDHDRALSSLEAAWTAGERGPPIEAALGAELGAAYESRLGQIERTTSSRHREAELRAIATRYRDPAMTHLRAALAAGAGSPAYLEALIAFHDRRYADAGRAAHAAFAGSPTFYEAGMLEARAHHQAARALEAADRASEAPAEHTAALQIFERVVAIARSDDEAWLRYAEVLHGVAGGTGRYDPVPELEQQAIAALHTVREINPERWDAVLREADMHESRANREVLWYRDPSRDVDQVLALASEARALGADADQVDGTICRADWERSVHEVRHGIDPHATLADAIAACARAVAVKPDFDNLGTLGLIYSTLAGYDAEHGVEPTPAFELGTRNLRAAIAIDDGEATVHYNLGRHWTRLAHYQTGHGEDPLRAVDDALVELAATVRLDAGRADGWAAMSEALIERARFQRAQHQEAQPTLERARAMLERALAVNPEILPPIRHRILLAELEAEAVLERHADPTSAVGRMRADAELLLRRRPGDGFGHRLLCRADLLAARWALAHRDAVERWLASATAEATHARETDPMDALAWIASAEVEQLRAQAARARGSAPNAAITRGRAFIERAMAIDPRLVRTRELRDELAR
jgi:serine/threonine-protein kinase